MAEETEVQVWEKFEEVMDDDFWMASKSFSKARRGRTNLVHAVLSNGGEMP